MTAYVRRVSATRTARTGPMPDAQAEREAAAWRAQGWSVQVTSATPNPSTVERRDPS